MNTRIIRDSDDPVKRIRRIIASVADTTEPHAPRPASRIWRFLGSIGVAGLAVLGVAYWLTYEPAPRIRVKWRDGVTVPHQTLLEQRYLLLNRREPLAEGSVAYDLLDTSRRNIKAIVDDLAIEDTNDIERHTYVVRFETDYGGEWMWIAHRTPGLRETGVQISLIAVLAVMAIGGFGSGRLRRVRAA